MFIWGVLESLINHAAAFTDGAQADPQAPRPRRRGHRRCGLSTLRRYDFAAVASTVGVQAVEKIYATATVPPS